MYINEDVLKFYLDDNKNYEKLEKSKKLIVDRFDFVNNTLSQVHKVDIEWSDIQKDIKRYINNVKENFPNDSDYLINCAYDKSYFGLGRIFVVNKQLVGMRNQNDAFNNRLQNIEKDFVLKLLFVMSGYDFDTKKAINEYRILSNTSVNPDFSGSTYSQRRCGWINSHFSDNTLFIEFVNFINNCKKKYDGSLVKRTNIALCYPGRVTNEKEVANDYKKQKEILEFRFPYKFMWMWANADSVIHPISLDAFRNFLKSDFMQEIFKEDEFKKQIKDKFGDNINEYPKKITDCYFNNFPEIWKLVSDKIYNKFFQKNEKYDEKSKNLQKLSKVISFLCIGETDMKNISDLLETHKQIILYGVPGTGKTYSAKKVVYDWIKKLKNSNNNEENADNNKDKEDINKIIEPYRIKNFKKSENNEINSDKNIVWDIVQFHPNYSYQDFIGGIAPKVDNGGSLSYTLNHGIFKKFCNCASLKNNKNKKFIFIIDEINRANLSEVFGELLYALEYRDESVSVANFNKFCIPSNVYIIGTMNNVDKSLATFDLALRRRFGFYEVGVDYDVIAGIIPNTTEENNSQETNNDKNIKTNINGYIKRCKELNYLLTNDERLKQEINIEGLKGIKLENTQDYYKIGHAYFMKIKNFMDKDEFVINPQHLEKLWIYHIEPLLMEYLGLSYDDSDVKKSVEEIKKHFVKELDNE